MYNDTERKKYSHSRRSLNSVLQAFANFYNLVQPFYIIICIINCFTEIHQLFYHINLGPTKYRPVSVTQYSVSIFGTGHIHGSPDNSQIKSNTPGRISQTLRMTLKTWTGFATRSRLMECGVGSSLGRNSFST